MTPVAVFFDLDDTLLDDTGAKRAYVPQLFAAWRGRLPHWPANPPRGVTAIASLRDVAGRL